MVFCLSSLNLVALCVKFAVGERKIWTTRNNQPTIAGDYLKRFDGERKSAMRNVPR